MLQGNVWQMDCITASICVYTITSDQTALQVEPHSLRASRYDHLAQIPEGTAALATQDVLHQLNNISCGGRCAVGSGGKSVGAPWP